MVTLSKKNKVGFSHALAHFQLIHATTYNIVYAWDMQGYNTLLAST